MKKLGCITALATLSLIGIGCDAPSNSSLTSSSSESAGETGGQSSGSGGVNTSAHSYSADDTVCLQSSLSIIAMDGNVQVGGLNSVGGDILLLNNSTMQLGGDDTVDGTIYLDTNASYQMGGSCTIGPVSQDDLSTDYTYLVNFVDKLDSLTPTQTFSNITTGMTITRTTVLNVIHVTGDIRMGGTQTLTLSGQLHDVFVINVDGDVQLGGLDNISLGGQLQATNVIINAVGTGGNIEIGGDNVVNGTLIAMNRGIQVGGSTTVNGALMSGVEVAVGGTNCIWNPQPFCVTGIGTTSSPSPTPTPSPSASPSSSPTPSPTPTPSPSSSSSPSPSPSCTDLVCPGNPFPGGGLGT